MSGLTVFLARLIGLFTMILGFSLALHRQESAAAIEALIHSPELLLVVGLITLVVGLAIVLRHNVWSGGAIPTVITLIGWVLLLRGVLLLSLPVGAVASVLAAVHFEDLFYAYVGAAIAIGLWLTYAGFTAKAPGMDPVKK